MVKQETLSYAGVWTSLMTTIWLGVEKNLILKEAKVKHCFTDQFQ